MESDKDRVLGDKVDDSSGEGKRTELAKAAEGKKLKTSPEATNPFSTTSDTPKEADTSGGTTDAPASGEQSPGGGGDAAADPVE